MLPWKYINHGVDPVLLVGLHVLDHLQAELQKLAVEEPVHQEHLPWNTDTSMLVYVKRVMTSNIVATVGSK